MTFCLQFKRIIYVIFGDIVVCRVYKRICGIYQIYGCAEFKSAVARIEIFSIWSEIYRIYLWVGSLSPSSRSSSLCSSLSYLILSFFFPSLLSLLSPPFFLSIFPSLLSSLFCLLSSPSFFLSLLSSYYLLSLSFFFPFLFLSSSLLLFFSSLSPSPLCSLLSACSYF